MNLEDTIIKVAEMTDREPNNPLWNYSLKWLLELKNVRAESDNKLLKAYKLGYADGINECNKKLSKTINMFEKVFDDQLMYICHENYTFFVTKQKGERDVCKYSRYF